jgi:hypothetical protein
MKRSVVILLLTLSATALPGIQDGVEGPALQLFERFYALATNDPHRNNLILGFFRRNIRELSPEQIGDLTERMQVWWQEGMQQKQEILRQYVSANIGELTPHQLKYLLVGCGANRETGHLLVNEILLKRSHEDRFAPGDLTGKELTELGIFYPVDDNDRERLEARAARIQQWDKLFPLQDGAELTLMAPNGNVRARYFTVNGEPHVTRADHFDAARVMRSQLELRRVPASGFTLAPADPRAEGGELPKSWPVMRLWVSRRPGQQWTEEGLTAAIGKAKCGGIILVGE